MKISNFKNLPRLRFGFDSDNTLDLLYDRFKAAKCKRTIRIIILCVTDESFYVY